MRRIKTAIIGSGFMGRVHLEAVRRLGFVDICAVANPNKSSAQRLAADFGIDRVESDYRAVLSDGDVEAVHICTPNALHFPMASDALKSGKHVLCEKPLAISSAEARQLVELAARTGRRNCLCHNLRYYPMVQQMRDMRESGDLGEILTVEGTYSQDWLLYNTDWNWRVSPESSGPSRCMADIGTHWCDMAEHITGMKITSLCSDLQTFHTTRKRPTTSVETFANKDARPAEYAEIAVSTEDFGITMFRMGERARGCFSASQVSAGRKNQLLMEIHGTKGSVGWNSEDPDYLWIGKRDTHNESIVKDPSLLKSHARAYADLPGGHGEGYADTFKQVFRRFYNAVADPGARVEYPQFADGLRQLLILETELESHRQHKWMDVPVS